MQLKTTQNNSKQVKKSRGQEGQEVKKSRSQEVKKSRSQQGYKKKRKELNVQLNNSTTLCPRPRVGRPFQTGLGVSARKMLARRNRNTRLANSLMVPVLSYVFSLSLPIQSPAPYYETTYYGGGMRDVLLPSPSPHSDLLMNYETTYPPGQAQLQHAPGRLHLGQRDHTTSPRHISHLVPGRPGTPRDVYTWVPGDVYTWVRETIQLAPDTFLTLLMQLSKWKQRPN